MRRLLALLYLLSGAALAQSPSNPPIGSVWTYSGAGPGWAQPVACPSIVSFGGNGDDTADNVAAWGAAVAATSCITFPPGIFRFNGAISYTFPGNTKGLTIVGSGQDVTVLHFPGAVGTALTLTMVGLSDSFHLRDLTLTTGTTNADTGLKVTQSRTQVSPAHASGYANSDITRVTLRSDEGYWEQDAGSVTHGWKIGIQTLGVSVINFVEVTFYGPKPATGGYATLGGNGGTGISIAGIAPGTWLPVLFNFDRVNINWAETGIIYGNYVQGFQIVGSNLTNCYTGISVPAGSVNLAQLAINTSQFNNIKNIVINSQVPQLILTGNLFYVPNDNPILTYTKPSWMTQITGNTFAAITAHQGTGLLLTPDGVDASPPVISGNTFWYLKTALNIGANEDGVLVSGNMYRNNVTNVVNASTSVYNAIAGGTPAFDWAGTQPTWLSITGAVNNGAGKVRATVSSTAGLFNGQLVLAGGITGIPGISTGQYVVTTVNIFSGTQVDLVNVTFGGSYTSGGIIVSLPL